MPRRREILPALLLSGTLGCNALFGIDDATLEDKTDSGTSGGAAGNGATGGGAGVAGSGGGAGGGGLAGGGGASGGGGLAGMGGSAGAAGSGGCTANVDTDPDNCGSCGHSCLGASCAGGQCQPELVTTAIHGSVSVTPTTSAIFWGNSLTGDLYRYDRTTKSTTNEHVGVDVWEVYAEGSYVYAFVNKGDEIFRAPEAGGAPKSIVKIGAPTDSFNVDASGVYWATCASASSGELYRANLDGTGVAKLVDITLCPLTVRLDAAYIYLAGAKSIAIYRVPKAAPHTPQAIGSPNPGAIALDVTDTHAFFADFDNIGWGVGKVYRVPKAGGSPLTIAKDQLVTSAVLYADGKVYWANRGTWPTFGDGSVWVATVQGTTVGPDVSLGTGLGNPESLAMDATHVYWLLSGSNAPTQGAIYRVAR